jgi:hypothetical protein
VGLRGHALRSPDRSTDCACTRLGISAPLGGVDAQRTISTHRAVQRLESYSLSGAGDTVSTSRVGSFVTDPYWRMQQHRTTTTVLLCQHWKDCCTRFGSDPTVRRKSFPPIKPSQSMIPLLPLCSKHRIGGISKPNGPMDVRSGHKPLWIRTTSWDLLLMHARSRHCRTSGWHRT